MTTKEIDLGSLFGAVSTSLAQNRESINTTDAYNANHGDNMVENFRLITRAVNRKKGATPAEQLAYASQVLSKNATTGSARMYSQGLAKAADQLRGQPAITQENAMVLLQALLGGQSTAQPSNAAPSDPLGGLLGSMLGGGQTNAQANQPEDLFGGLLSNLMGGSSGQSQAQPAPDAAHSGGFDMNTLLTAGMAFLQSRQQGATPVQALVNAVMAGSQMNATPHHSQSGQLVATTLINTITSMLAK
jgi:phosphoenolpyruvate---glycerone phosphotransferase subunit DhaL